MFKISRPFWWIGFITISIGLLIPLMVVEVPPILDYPNHLARMFVLSRGLNDPILSQVYASHWTLLPNLATDSILPFMIDIMNPYLAGRIMLGMILLITFSGIVIYNKAVFGSVNYWSLAGALVCYNAVFLLGFMNFLLSSGVALWLASCWVFNREKRPLLTWGIAFLSATLLFFGHLMGLVFFMILIASHEADAIWNYRHQPWRRICLFTIKRAVIAGSLLVVPLILYVMTSLEKVSAPPITSSLTDKFWQAFYPFVNYLWKIDFMSVLLVTAMVGWGFFKGYFKVPVRTFVTGFLLLGFYVMSPFFYKGTYFVDTRFTIMMGYMFFAGTQMELSIRFKSSIKILGILLALFITRTGVVTEVWWLYNTELADLRSVMAFVPEGSKVLLTGVSREENAFYWSKAPLSRQISDETGTDTHRAALLVIERKAFWPQIFADPTQQPLSLKEPYRKLVEITGVVPPHTWLQGIDMNDQDKIDFPIWKNWNHYYDYVLLLNAGAEKNPAGFASDKMELLKATDVAAIYKVKK